MQYDFFKRLLDIVGSLLCIGLFSPILLIAAIAVKISSPGPVFVESSNRVGKNGAIFRMYKFRSMIKDAHNLIRTDPKFAERYEEYKKSNFKLKDDPRVTKIGKVLRSTSIDEFPQFFNVLKGDMSLVGPRAYYPDELEENKKNFPQSIAYINDHLKVKPGMTGLWQVSGRSRIGFEKRIQLDSEYVKRRSIMLDLEILSKTPAALFDRDGIY